MTNEPEFPAPPRTSVPWNTRIIRLGNLLRQGASDLVAPPAASVAPSPDWVLIDDQGAHLRVQATDLPVPFTAETVAALAAKSGGRPVDLVFAGNSCLDLAFTLPAAPLPELRRIVATELQFRSPFAEDVSLSFWAGREQADGRWKIVAAVLLKSQVEPVLAALRAQGSRIGVVRRTAAGASFAAEPPWAVDRRGEPAVLQIVTNLPATARLVLGGAAVLLASAIALSLSLALGAARLAPEADAARAALGAKAAASASVRSLDQALARSTDRLAMTGLLTERLPDGYWLDQLAIEQDSVTLTGFGPSAAEVTRILTTVPQLADIAFASPVTRDNTQSLERFRIAAALVGAGP